MSIVVSDAFLRLSTAPRVQVEAQVELETGGSSIVGSKKLGFPRKGSFSLVFFLQYEKPC